MNITDIKILLETLDKEFPVDRTTFKGRNTISLSEDGELIVYVWYTNNVKLIKGWYFKASDDEYQNLTVENIIILIKESIESYGTESK